MENQYKDQIISNLKSHEKSPDDVRIGLEIEHFIIWEKTKKSVTYYEERGIRDLLLWFEKSEWKGQYEGDHIIGLSNGQQLISLEPGAQLEFSSSPVENIKDLENEYSRFLDRLKVWTAQNDQTIASCGYHPVSTISEIPLIPKEKYHMMDSYFGNKGKYAPNMMRGTGSTHLTFDYTNEADFVRKLRLAVQCTPIFVLLFSNCSSFEGVPYTGHSLRTEIWNACDDERCGVIPCVFTDWFGYDSFAAFILDMNPIVYYRDGAYIPSGEMTFLQMLSLFPPKDFTKTLTEALRMVFTDVRVKQFFELRMVDSLPQAELLMYASLVKEIFYNSVSFFAVGDLVKGIESKDVTAAMAELPEKGFQTEFGGRVIAELTSDLVETACSGPLSDTKEHLELLQDYLYCKLHNVTAAVK